MNNITHFQTDKTWCETCVACANHRSSTNYRNTCGTSCADTVSSQEYNVCQPSPSIHTQGNFTYIDSTHALRNVGIVHVLFCTSYIIFLHWITTFRQTIRTLRCRSLKKCFKNQFRLQNWFLLIVFRAIHGFQ